MCALDCSTHSFALLSIVSTTVEIKGKQVYSTLSTKNAGTASTKTSNTIWRPSHNMWYKRKGGSRDYLVDISWLQEIYQCQSDFRVISCYKFLKLRAVRSSKRLSKRGINLLVARHMYAHLKTSMSKKQSAQL